MKSEKRSSKKIRWSYEEEDADFFSLQKKLLINSPSNQVRLAGLW